MIKLLNKLFYYLKNFLLPILFVITMYIVMYMSNRLGKNIFGDGFLEFFSVLLPFVSLIFCWILNIILKQESIKDNIFYNFVSFFAMLTIFVFCYRTVFDKNMIMWHKYGYNINFNYFSDQLIVIRVLLYCLLLVNILLMIYNHFFEKNVHK